jgi:predicted nucleic acid-binding protein
MTPKPTRVYVDSSVFGGVFDEEFEIASQCFFDLVRAGRFVLLTSESVKNELSKAPDPVQKLFLELLPQAELIPIGKEVLALSTAYLAAGILSPNWSEDALHVATATVGQADLIVSWNFKHIVHFEKIPRYNEVNRLHGWHELAIYSPQEVIHDENEEKDF